MKTELGIATNWKSPEPRLDDGPFESAGRTGRPLSALERLKNRLLEQQLASVTEAELRRRLQRAADESASLAWTTSFPLLTLPELLAEKGREARHQFERQHAILARSQIMPSMAA
jgi:hypothetical protein